MPYIESFLAFFKAKRSKFLLGFFALFILLTFVAIKNGVLAQVSNIVARTGATATSPSGLKLKPVDNGDDTRRNTDDMRSRANTENENIPEHIVYGQIFRHIKELNKKADEEESQGKDGAKFRKLYKSMANLDDAQADILDGIAKKTNVEIEKLDKKAKKIIADFRAKTPEGKLKQGELPPAPPAELNELSNGRKNLILGAIDELHKELGETGFTKFKAFVDEKVKPGVKRINN
jgi:MFS superfamily sulfate permease-like transporter